MLILDISAAQISISISFPLCFGFRSSVVSILQGLMFVPLKQISNSCILFRILCIFKWNIHSDFRTSLFSSNISPENTEICMFLLKVCAPQFQSLVLGLHEWRPVFVGSEVAIFVPLFSPSLSLGSFEMFCMFYSMGSGWFRYQCWIFPRLLYSLYTSKFSGWTH